ncbi:membrane protein [Anoxybacteroides tepidamans]|uniref:YkvI family membrane protein n=1 Tax=Anoxybacteroides tepidamans TaxID=265948 RepID=UPI00054EC13D|nr:membrane protein [Anoxybacillus tepidamans]
MAWQIAAVYVGTVVGAGFATGKEIVEFFTQYGVFGTIGVFISGGLFAWSGARMMMMARALRASSYKQLNDYLFGKTASSMITIIMTIMIVGVTSVMLSGAGALFEEQLGLSKQVGIAFTICLVFAVMLYDVKGLFAVNVLIVPMMLLFSFFLFGKLMLGEKWCNISFFPHYSWRAFFSPFSYTAFNLAMAQTVLVPLAVEAEDEQAVRWGAWLGGILLTLILLSSHIILLSFPHVLRYDIPMAKIVQTFFAYFYWLYLLVIYGEIFTSIVGGVFGLKRQFRTFGSLFFLIVLFVILYLISLFRYGSLLSFLYPIFGYISLLFLLLLMCRKIPRL